MDPRLAKTVVLGEEPERAVALLRIGRGSRLDLDRGAGDVSGPPEDYELYMTRTKRLVPGIW